MFRMVFLDRLLTEYLRSFLPPRSPRPLSGLSVCVCFFSGQQCIAVRLLFKYLPGKKKKNPSLCLRKVVWRKADIFKHPFTRWITPFNYKGEKKDGEGAENRAECS